MARYLEPLLTALAFFPAAAAIFTLPYLIYCYRRYGSVLFMRVVCVYGFILYLLCVYCLAILPFPDADTVVTQKVGLNLIPFNYVPELLTKPVDFSITRPATWMSALFSSGLYEPLLNTVMFFPLGIFLRYYFGLSRRKTVLCALLLSLFLELTQLTATYGLAPFPYRVCDVNDLIDNTLGGFLGYLATPLVTFILPTRERLSQVSYQRGARVSYVRRSFAFLTDLFLIMALTLAAETLLPGVEEAWIYLLTTAIYMGLLPRLWRGQTPGKALVRVRIVDASTRMTAKLWQYLARGLMLYVCFLRTDILLSPFVKDANQQLGALAVSNGMCVLLFLCAVYHGMKNESQMGYEEWTHTLQISTVVLPGARTAKIKASGASDS